MFHQNQYFFRISEYIKFQNLNESYLCTHVAFQIGLLSVSLRFSKIRFHNQNHSIESSSIFRIKDKFQQRLGFQNFQYYISDKILTSQNYRRSQNGVLQAGQLSQSEFRLNKYSDNWSHNKKFQNLRINHEALGYLSDCSRFLRTEQKLEWIIAYVSEMEQNT